MADEKRVAAPATGTLGSIGDILQLFNNGKSSSTTSSDTSALSGVLGNLQGTQDYGALLKSIFTQAGGQIPGLTGAMSNAVGARTGGNSAVSAQLGKLLESTVLKGTQQVAQLQQGNQALQVQAAGGIANGNRTTTGSTAGSGVNQALAGLTLAGKFLDSGTGKKLLEKGKDFLGLGGTDAAGNLSTPELSSFDFGSAGGGNFGSASGGFNFGDATTSLGDFSGLGSAFDFGSAAGDVAGDAASGSAGDFIDFGEFFADGGLVGRDGTKNPSPDWQGKDQTPGNAATMGPSAQAGSPQSYADGGQVKAGGGRVSSRPTYNPQAPVQTSTVSSPRDALNPQRDLQLPTLQMEPNSNTGEGVSPSSASEASGTGTAESVAVGNAIGNAVGAAVMSAVVGPTAMAALNATQSITGVNTPQSAISQAVTAIAQALGISSTPNGVSTNNSGLTPQAMEAMAAAGGGNASNAGDGNSSSTGSGADAAGGVGGSGAGEGGIGTTAGSGNDGGDNGAGDGATSGDSGYKDGGSISGKGTGTSDSIKANVSQGEYIMPADVVQSLGVRFFDEIRNHFHTPAAVQNAK